MMDQAKVLGKGEHNYKGKVYKQRVSVSSMVKKKTKKKKSVTKKKVNTTNKTVDLFENIDKDVMKKMDKVEKTIEGM